MAVDIRPDSISFGKWVGVELSGDNNRQLWIPEGYAHGFQVISDSAVFLYKTTNFYSPEHERCIRWDDPTLSIDWPIKDKPLVSDKDAEGVLLRQL